MAKGITLRKLAASSAAMLPELANLLRHEHFVLTDIDFDANDRVARVPFWRINHGGPREAIRNGWLFRVERVDVVRSMLWINDVSGYEPVGEMEMHTYAFSGVKYDRHAGRLTFVCKPGLALNFTVGGISIQASDLMVAGKAHVHVFPVLGAFYDGEVAE